MRTQVLQRLHQPTSHVTRFGSLDGSIDQTFSTRDSVKQEFGRGQSGKETVPNETFGGWGFGLFAEMGQ